MELRQLLRFVLLSIFFLGMGCSNTNKSSKELKATQMALTNLWVLTAIDGEDIDARDLPKGAPTLMLSIAERYYWSSTGCSVFHGRLDLKGETITFFPGPMTLEDCSDKELEDEYLRRLLHNGILHFQFTAGYLVLISDQNTSLQWKVLDDEWNPGEGDASTESN